MKFQQIDKIGNKHVGKNYLTYIITEKSADF